MTEDHEEEEEIEEIQEDDREDPLNSSTDSTSTSLTAIMKPTGGLDFAHKPQESSRLLPGPSSTGPMRSKKRKQKQEESQKPKSGLAGFQMPDSPKRPDQIEPEPVPESVPEPPTSTREKIRWVFKKCSAAHWLIFKTLNVIGHERYLASIYLKPSISTKNRASTIIQSQRRLQNAKKTVLSQAAQALIGSSDSSSDEEIELSYRSQRLRTSTQAPGGAPIGKIIAGSSQSQIKIQNTVNESTAIVPDTQPGEVKAVTSTNESKSDQSECVIPDTDELEESSSEKCQTRLSRMSQASFQFEFVI